LANDGKCNNLFYLWRIQPIPQNTEKEAILKQMEQQIQHQDMIEKRFLTLPHDYLLQYAMPWRWCIGE
jgi:spermidine/putrescine-binding protein